MTSTWLTPTHGILNLNPSNVITNLGQTRTSLVQYVGPISSIEADMKSMKSCIYCNYTDTQSSTRDQKKSTNCLQITVNFFHFKSCYCNFHFDLLQLNHCEPYLRARRPTCHILKVPRIKSSHSAALLITTFQWFKQYCSKCNAMAKFTRLMKALPLRLPYEWFDLTATRY